MITDAFEEFYRDRYLAMVRLACGLVDILETAEEITQDAFAKVFERWDRLDNPAGYLRTAVVNGARGELRKREVRRRIRPGRPQQVPVQQDYLLDALERLPTRRRTALVLRYYGDLSEREIADPCWNWPALTDAPPGEFSALSASSSRTCALTVGGDILCWEGFFRKIRAAAF